MNIFTDREQIVEVVNKLFVYTDQQEWAKLQNEVFTEEIHLDMSSLGGPNENKSGKEVCEMWDEGFKDLDAVNHLGGNYLVTLTGEGKASVFAYATATHYKDSATQGKTREFVGTYHLGLTKTGNGWHINTFKYNLKYVNGNMDLK